MMNLRAVRSGVVALVCCPGLVFSTNAQAGLLEMLFGIRPMPHPFIEQPPLEMTIRKSHKHSRKPARPKEAKKELQTPIDIAKEPEWFLKDRTLRRGDVVVLPDRVVVFSGNGRQTGMDDFVSLESTALLSKKQKQAIMAVTQAPVRNW
jgi:hypothetical protein